MLIRKWRPRFKSTENAFDQIITWARIASLPSEFYEKQFLTKLESGIGKIIKLDTIIGNFERGNYARVCVQIDTNRPLIRTLLIDKDEFAVTYEGLPNFCSSYGKWDHNVDQCTVVASASPPKPEQRTVMSKEKEES